MEKNIVELLHDIQHCTDSERIKELNYNDIREIATGIVDKANIEELHWSGHIEKILKAVVRDLCILCKKAYPKREGLNCRCAQIDEIEKVLKPPINSCVECEATIPIDDDVCSKCANKE